VLLRESKRFQIHPAGDANIRYVALVNNEGAAPIPGDEDAVSASVTIAKWLFKALLITKLRKC
jgi:hypothetical protein